MKIFLDAGHNYSGGDTGTIGNGLREQDITYFLTKKVGDILRIRGVNIVYSRPVLNSNVGTTVSESINGRVSMANQWGADYFVSIHCNASTAASANGTETLIYAKGGKAEQLADKVNARLVELGLTNRGVKVRTDLGVIKNTNMPAILVEAAFITNSNDANILLNKQDGIAQAIANGISEFLGIGDVGMFKDVKADDYAYKHIEKLKNYGIINGDTAGRFNPDMPITRRDMAIVVANALTICGK